MHTVYSHDCDNCKPIQAIIRSDGKTVDWYFCEDSNIFGGSIIGRFGDIDREYWSIPLDVLKSHLNLANSSSVSEMFNQSVCIYQLLRARKVIE